MIPILKSSYEKTKKYIPTVCFLGGSIWDILTLRRIDNTLDLLIFSGYLVLSAVIIILISRKVTFKFSEHLPSAVQFFLGGLFSGCTVYYFKSTSSLPAFLFVLFLASILVGNEFLEKKYSNAQIAFTFWSLSALMILNFLLPIIAQMMSSLVFIVTILISYSLSEVVRRFSGSKSISRMPVILIYVVFMVLYFTNIIPPVPVSNKQMLICHSIHKNSSGYDCSYEPAQWYQFFLKQKTNFIYTPGDTVFCFSSVFAPTRFKAKIYHHWYFKDPKTKKYCEKTKIGFQLTGGRDDGFRGFTFKKSVEPGKWLVKLKTEDGKTVGAVSFTIVSNLSSAQSLKIKTITY